MISRNHQFPVAEPEAQNHQFTVAKSDSQNHRFPVAEPSTRNHQVPGDRAFVDDFGLNQIQALKETRSPCPFWSRGSFWMAQSAKTGSVSRGYLLI